MMNWFYMEKCFIELYLSAWVLYTSYSSAHEGSIKNSADESIISDIIINQGRVVDLLTGSVLVFLFVFLQTSARSP